MIIPIFNNNFIKKEFLFAFLNSILPRENNKHGAGVRIFFFFCIYACVEKKKRGNFNSCTERSMALITPGGEKKKKIAVNKFFFSLTMFFVSNKK